MAQDLGGVAAAAVLRCHRVADVTAEAEEEVVQLVADRDPTDLYPVDLGDQPVGRDAVSREIDALGVALRLGQELRPGGVR